MEPLKCPWRPRPGPTQWRNQEIPKDDAEGLGGVRVVGEGLGAPQGQVHNLNELALLSQAPAWATLLGICHLLRTWSGWSRSVPRQPSRWQRGAARLGTAVATLLPDLLACHLLQRQPGLVCDACAQLAPDPRRAWRCHGRGPPSSGTLGTAVHRWPRLLHQHQAPPEELNRRMVTLSCVFMKSHGFWAPFWRQCTVNGCM